LRLIIIDACRDNPFTNRMQRTIATRMVSRGLAKVEPAGTDTLIAYAAKAGSTAEDGTDRHSPFTQALLNNLPEPGLDVRIAFGRVRDEVLKKTGNRQEPFVYGSLGGTTISLIPPPAAPARPAPAAADIRSDYELAERVGTLEGWNSFLAVHPSGFYAALAREQRAKLLAASPGAPSPAEPRAAVAALPAAKPADRDRATADRLAWEKIQDTSDLSALRAFIKRYPNSPLALTAQHRLELLEQAAAQRRQQELERQKAEREAARQRQEEERRAKAAEAERLKLERETARRRQEEEQRAEAAQAGQERAQEPPANTPDLVRSAQKELRRIGCYAGRDSGRLDASTRRAIEDYRAKSGQPAEDIKVTGTLVAELEGHGPIANCIVALPKPEPVARPKEKAKPEPVVERRREKAKPAEKREARPARAAPPRARAQAATPARPGRATSGSGGMIGVGF
jgi:hypothetical protein